MPSNENTLVEIPEHKSTLIAIDDEWDTNEICDKIVENKRVIIRALFPGSGKSYICEHLHNKGYNVLFVCPTNKLVEDFDTSMTTN